MHQAGAVALSQLPRYEPPGVDELEMPCACGQTARYRERRSRNVLTAVGDVEFPRPWFLCPRCHNGQFPADAALRIEKDRTFSRHVPPVGAGRFRSAIRSWVFSWSKKKLRGEPANWTGSRRTPAR
jgi:hypothetical protein